MEDLSDLATRCMDESIITVEFPWGWKEKSYNIPKEFGGDVHYGMGPPLDRHLPWYARVFQDRAIKDTLITPQAGNPRSIFPHRLFVARYDLHSQRALKSVLKFHEYSDETDKENARRAHQWLFDRIEHPACIYVDVYHYRIIGNAMLIDRVYHAITQAFEHPFQFTKEFLNDDERNRINEFRQMTGELDCYNFTRGVFRAKRKFLVSNQKSIPNTSPHS